MNDRIAFVNFIPQPSRWPGVANKLLQQARATARGSIATDVIVLSSEPPLPTPIITVPLASGGKQVMGRFGQIRQALGNRGYRALVLRYANVSDPSFLWAWDGHHPPVISEHHTNQIEELSLLASGLRGRLRLLAEQTLGTLALSRVAGLIGVTDSIRASQVARIRRPPPSAVVSNGVTVGDVLPHGPAPWTGTAQIAFSAGNFSHWHGLDRLLAGLIAYNGRVPIVLDLIGDLLIASDLALITELNQRAGLVKVICHGRLDERSQNRILAGCQIAISSLGLHRLGMPDGSPLKSREYAARGLPFAYSYTDPDLPGDLPGTLSIPGDDSPIDPESLIKFALSVSTVTGDGLRRFAEEHLDWSIRMRKMHHFAISCSA